MFVTIPHCTVNPHHVSANADADAQNHRPSVPNVTPTLRWSSRGVSLHGHRLPSLFRRFFTGFPAVRKRKTFVRDVTMAITAFGARPGLRNKAMKQSHDESQTIRLQVAGMDCPDEIKELKYAFKGHAGILDLSFNLMQGAMTVGFDPSATDPDTIISIVRTTGMEATPMSDRAAPTNQQSGGERKALNLTRLPHRRRQSRVRRRQTRGRDRKSTRLNSSHTDISRMPSSA